jgi:hypothetical protein
VVDPLPEKRFQAEAVVAVHSDDASGATRAGQWRTFAAALETPEVLRSARTSAELDWPLDEVRASISAIGSPESGLLRVRGVTASQPSAERLVDAATTQAVALMRRSAQTNLVRPTAALFDLETSSVEWRRPAPRFTFAPRELRRVEGDAHSGAFYLEVQCRARNSGCGPSVELTRTFDAKVAYAGRVYARARQPVRLRAVLGNEARDVAVGASTLVREEWEPLTVTWTPRRSHGAADLAVQVTDSNVAEFDVDTASVRDPGDLMIEPELELQANRQAELIRAERAAREDRYSVISMSEAVEQVPDSTVGSGLYGAAIGLGAALAAFAAAALARERERDGQDQPDA